MTKCDWDVLLEGMEWEAVKNMVTKPDSKEPLYKVITAFKLYLSDVSDQLRQTGLTLRHQILEGVKYFHPVFVTNYSDRDMGLTFHALQEQKTIDSYAETTGLFLVFCLRSMHGEDLRWSRLFPFNMEQLRSLTELDELVIDEEEPVTRRTWTAAIHRTFKSFVNCDEVRRMVAEVEWPLYRFLIAMSINSTTDGFGDPANVPHIVKRLVYCIRANIFEQARLMATDDEEDMDDDNRNDRPTLDFEGGLFGLKKYIIDNGQTPFNTIRFVSNLARKVAAGDPNVGFVDWNIDPADPERYDVLSINNKSFRFSKLLHFVEQLLTDTDRLLFIDILSDVRLPSTDLAEYEPRESFNNRTYHASAFTEPANIFVNHKEDVIKSWLGNRRKRGTLVRSVTVDGIHWKRTAVMSWLDKCLVYLQTIFVLLQVTWGGARPSIRDFNRPD